MTTEKTSKKTPIFSCEKCDFICSKQNEYNRHIITNKHKRLHDTTEKNPINEPKTFNCKCGKIYRHHTSLAKHKHCCKGLNISDNISNVSFTGINKEEEEEEETSGSVSFNENVIITKDMFMAILNDRQEMLKIIKSLSEQQNSNTTNNTTNHNNMITTTTNSNNNTFNMNLFLNEKCKDAMNMKDFVNSIQLNMTDLENVGRLGYVEGMSNIFIDNLQKTDVYKRPIHCSDIKRETLYVKDNNQWERDGPDHQKMTNAVLAVEQKNVALVNEWAKANPRCMNSNTRENETYFKLSKAATDGEKDGNIDKVIRKVAKKVIIEKDA